MALDVRLPPLHPKVAALLQFMTVGHGSLFAGRLTQRLSSALHLLGGLMHTEPESQCHIIGKDTDSETVVNCNLLSGGKLLQAQEAHAYVQMLG